MKDLLTNYYFWILITCIVTFIGFIIVCTTKTKCNIIKEELEKEQDKLDEKTLNVDHAKSAFEIYKDTKTKEIKNTEETLNQLKIKLEIEKTEFKKEMRKEQEEIDKEREEINKEHEEIEKEQRGIDLLRSELAKDYAEFKELQRSTREKDTIRKLEEAEKMNKLLIERLEFVDMRKLEEAKAEYYRALATNKEKQTEEI